MKKYDELQGGLYTLSFHESQNCTETQTTIQNKLKKLKKKIDSKKKKMLSIEGKPHKTKEC